MRTNQSLVTRDFASRPSPEISNGLFIMNEKWWLPIYYFQATENIPSCNHCIGSWVTGPYYGCGKCRAEGSSRWLPQQCLRLFILGTKLNCWQMLTSSQCSGTQGSGWPTGEGQQWQLQLLIAQKRGSFGHGALLRSTKVGWSQETGFWMMSS